MSNKERSIHIIEFSGKKTDWDSGVSTGTTSGVDKIPTYEEFENALERNEDLDKKIIKLGELNELACEGFILSIKASSSVGKVAFGLVKNAKNDDFPEKSCKVVWDRLVNKYAPHTASSLQISWSQLIRTLTSGFLIWKGFKFE